MSEYNKYTALIPYAIKMVNEILENWEKTTWKWLNTKNEDLTETLDEQKFREYMWEDLIKKHVKVEYWEKFWYQWKILRINLPAAWDFGWYKFECFISDVAIQDFQYDKKYEEFSFSRDEIEKFDERLSAYLKSYWVKRYWYSHEFFHVIYKIFEEPWSFRLRDNVWYENSSYNSKIHEWYLWHLLLKV